MILWLLFAFGAVEVFGYGTCLPGSRMKVFGGYFLACDNSYFIPRGVNLQYGDYPQQAFNAFQPIAQTGANTVRIELRTFTTAQQVQMALDAVLSQGMIPILMLWDSSTTCGDNVTSLMQVLSTWNSSDWKQVLMNETYAPYLILNPINEWSNVNTVNRTQFRDTYIQVVQYIRSLGYTNPLSLNSYHCGQFPDGFSYVLPDTGNMIGTDILNADPERSIVFSYHGYANLWNPSSAILANIQMLQQVGLPWLITEHGSKDASGYNVVDHNEFWAVTYAAGSGVLAWSWYGNSDTGLDMNYGYSSNALSYYGTDIVYGTYGIFNTAIRCLCLQNPSLHQ
jgi:mannan endo-1,4-beta-mannosidase